MTKAAPPRTPAGDERPDLTGTAVRGTIKSNKQRCVLERLTGGCMRYRYRPTLSFAAAGALLAALALILAIPAGGRAQTNALGAEVPASAQLVLTPAEQVEAVCATSRWRALEIYAALDAITQHRPAAMAALAAAGVDYVVPDPAPYRAQADSTLAEICAAPTLEAAFAGVNRLLLIHQDMEAGYGAVEEAFRPAVEARVAELSDHIRPQIEAWAEQERARVEAELNAEGQRIADAIVAEEEPRLEAQITAEAEAMAGPTVQEDQVRAYVQARVAELEAQARPVLTARVEAALAGRIAQERARIEAGAEALAEELQGAELETLKAIEEPFNRLKEAVAAAVDAARGAESPERRAAIEVRLRLALKVADAHLGPARGLVERAREPLASLRAANPARLDAPGLLALMDTERARLEERLRAALSAGDEVGFVAATVAFQGTWEEIARDVEEATMTWSAAQICGEALPAIDRARGEIEGALAGVRAGLGGELPEGDDGVQLVAALRSAESDLVAYLAELGTASQTCASPGTLEARTLIGSLDDLRVRGERVRLAVNEARALAESIGEGAR
jgi:hypothetical protein